MREMTKGDGQERPRARSFSRREGARGLPTTTTRKIPTTRTTTTARQWGENNNNGENDDGIYPSG
jgi:hypothetical protein